MPAIEILSRLRNSELTESESAHGWFKFIDSSTEGAYFASPMVIRKITGGALVDQP
jgi:hypothetical protein